MNEYKIPELAEKFHSHQREGRQCTIYGIDATELTKEELIGALLEVIEERQKTLPKQISQEKGMLQHTFREAIKHNIQWWGKNSIFYHEKFNKGE